MTPLDSLPPDQRAAVQLLLTQGQTYHQLGDLLAIDGSAVRRRAHAALAALGPDAGARLSAADRADLSDYLLGQQTVAGREDTHDLLIDMPEARAWARAVAEELAPLAPDALPEIPEGPPTAREPVAPRGRGRERTGATDSAPYADLPDDDPAGSRLGGALLLAGAFVVVALVAILLLTGGDDGPAVSTTATAPAQTQTSTTRTAADGTRPIAEVQLTPPGGGNRPVGLGRVFQRGQERAIIVAGQGVQPGAYALWLLNSPTQGRFLGFVPQRVGRDGRFATQGVLPPQAADFRTLAVTRENPSASRMPTRPGAIVLQGSLSLPR